MKNTKIEIEYEDEVVVIKNENINVSVVMNEYTIIKFNIIKNNESNINVTLDKYHRKTNIKQVNFYNNDDKFLIINSINKAELKINLYENEYSETLLLYNDIGGENNDN